MTTRGVRLFLVGSFVLVALAGCGRGFLTAEREPWRAEAEKACLKSGAVKETAELVRIDPISGPGVCGAEFPLKVAALGEGDSRLGYSGDVRPPNGIGQPRWPMSQSQDQSQPYKQPDPPSADNGARVTTPMQIHPVNGARDEDDVDLPDDPRQRVYSPRSVAPSPAPYSQPRLGISPGSPVNAFGPVAMTPTATLACPIVSALDRWLTDAVQPAAMRWFGTRVAEIKQISAYSCRGMNGNSRAHISEHAFGNALDIASFILADGRKISVRDGWKGMPEEQGFLRDIQGAACQQFNTVLAPGSNVYHYDHIHVDLMRRPTGRVICQPAAVSGEEIAARASSRGYAGRDFGRREITGSIATLGGKRKPRVSKTEDDDWVEDESHIKSRE